MAYISANQTLPPDLLYDIENFQGTSISTTPDDFLTPKSNLSRDDLDEFGKSNSIIQSLSINNTETDRLNCLKSEEKENAEIQPQEIPKSPHLGKDFSPTGERIRDSMRARRRQRLMQAQQRGLTPENIATDRVLEAVKQTLQHDGISKKSRPYGEKGFLLDINRDGDLSLNNVRDLNNCSDFDSSCDTSLNYHEVNAQDEQNLKSESMVSSVLLEEYPEGSNNATQTRVSKDSVEVEKNVQIGEIDAKSLSNMNQIQMKIGQKSYRNALDDIRTKLNLCKSKFDTLDEANRKNFSNSQNSMKMFFKMSPTEAACKKPPEALKMFQRLEADSECSSSAHTYRVNQTPVFGRKSFSKPLEFYVPRSESLENISCVPPIIREQTKTENSTSKRAKAHMESTFKSYLTADFDGIEETKLKNATASPEKNKLISRKENPNEKLEKNNSRILGLRTTQKPIINSRSAVQAKISTKQVVSPTKAGDVRKIALPQDTKSAQGYSRNRQVNNSSNSNRNTSPIKASSSRLTILSPEKVHRLNAKLSDQRKKLEASSRKNTDSSKSATSASPTTMPSTNTDHIVQTERRKRVANRSQL